MDDRKKQVLSAIINDYITTAEPVGSRAVAKKYGLGVSPATIRNEMSDLEELGYIEQPHTSAGRKPSDKGYRYYVDCLMEKEKLSDEEMSSIHEDIAFHLNEMDTFMQQCCQMLSRLTNYASMIVLPAPSQGCLERIQLLSINELQILALIISTTGAVRHKLIYLSHPLGREQIDYLQKLLQDRLVGLDMNKLNGALLKEIMGAVNYQQKIISQTMELLEQLFIQEKGEKIFSAGVLNMLSQPEFKDVEKIKGVFGLLEEDQRIKKILPDFSLQKGTHIAIGGEISEDNVKDCSMVIASYGADKDDIGSIGVLGPTRMSYPKTISLVEFIADELSQLLSHR